MSSLEFGQNGTMLKAIGNIASGPYNIIKAYEDSEVTVVSTWAGASNPETLVLSAGMTAEGIFSIITWVSGKIVAYK